MLFKCLGVVLQKSQKKAFVRDKLDLMFNTVDHNVADDRDGCAAGYGACALTNLDIVLDKLGTVINNDMKKKSSGFFGFSDKSDADVDKIKCTVMLCYGQAASKADVALVKSRIEVTILNNILPFFASAKSALVKVSSSYCNFIFFLMLFCFFSGVHHQECRSARQDHAPVPSSDRLPKLKAQGPAAGHDQVCDDQRQGRVLERGSHWIGQCCRHSYV